MMIENVKTNIVPSLTWNWLKSNNDVVSISQDTSAFYENNGKIAENVNGISVENIDFYDFADDFPKNLSGVFNKSNPKPVDLGYNKENSSLENIKKNNDKNFADKKNNEELHPIESVILKTAKNPKTIVIDGQNQKPFIINFNFDLPSVNKYSIFAKKDSLGTVVFVYKGESDSLIKTDVYIEENANLKIIKVQLLGKDCLNIDDTAIFQKENSKVHFVQIELGGKHVNSGLHVVLQGNNARFVSDTAYFTKGEQLLDMNHIVDHYGKKSESKMFVYGSLKDNSKKTYRGTIDLKKGCCGAKGNETEEVLLLSPKVVNKSLPVILCDEEDVEGEHGSTIGKLSKQMLFYMQTRGITEDVAEILFSRARIQAAADLILNENVKNEIFTFLDKS